MCSQTMQTVLPSFINKTTENQKEQCKYVRYQHTIMFTIRPRTGFTQNKEISRQDLPQKSQILLLRIPHTCHLYFKCQFFSSDFTDVFSSIFLLYTVDHQLTNLALWIHVNCSAETQLFAIFVPFHLCLVINYLTAQGGFLRTDSLLRKADLAQTSAQLTVKEHGGRTIIPQKSAPQHTQNTTKSCRCTTQSKKKIY